MNKSAQAFGQALYDLSKEEAVSGQLLAQLSELQGCFDAEPQFLSLLSTPSIPKQERCQILDHAFRGRIHPYLLNFLKLLVEQGHIRHYGQCLHAFHTEYNRDNGILEVTAVTAIPLSDRLREEMSLKIMSITGKTVRLTCRVDRQVLGGIRLELGDRQVDGTLRHRLVELHRILTDAHQKAGTTWN